MYRRIIPAATLLFLLVPSLWGQQPTNSTTNDILEHIRATNQMTLDHQVALCQIPSPPFGEAKRGAAFATLLADAGLHNVRVDAVGNVIGERPGQGAGPRVVLSAHLDTVFPEGTDVSVTQSGTRFEGPGIGDDCRGLAVILAVARGLQKTSDPTTGTLVVVGTVGEEGAGNLRGVRHLFDSLSAGPIDYFISVDGTGIEATISAVGSHRYRVTYHGPGGHSFGAFGMPNPVHALGRSIALLAEIRTPASPKTTFSVGRVMGGTSVNSIAMDASMDVDLRSESQDALDRLDADFQAALLQARDAERARWPTSTVALDVRVETIGKRPAGNQPTTSPIVQAAVTSAKRLGFTPSLTAASTDANIAISRGVPAITIDGGGSGGGSHSVGEWYDDGTNGYRGPQWAVLLVLTLLHLSPS